MKKLLWLDDVRDPFKSYWVERYSPIGTDVEINWVASYNDFVNYVKEEGVPDGVCFDHDLGEEYIKFYFENGGHENPPNPLDGTFVEKSGYDAAKWLCDYCYDNKLPIPPYNIQSSNPVGKQNIDSYIKNFIKYNY